MNNVVPMKPEPATPCSTPSLSDNVVALLRSSDSPVVGPRTAKALSEWVEAQRPRRTLAQIAQDGPEQEKEAMGKMDSLVGRMALATKERPLTPAANEERLDIYWRVLRNQTLVDLGAAFDELMRTLKWMPTPAEVYQAAARSKISREWPIVRAKHLIWLHEREWQPPIPEEDRPSAAEVRKILHGAEAQFPTSRCADVGMEENDDETN